MPIGSPLPGSPRCRTGDRTPLRTLCSTPRSSELRQDLLQGEETKHHSPAECADFWAGIARSACLRNEMASARESGASPQHSASRTSKSETRRRFVPPPDRVAASNWGVSDPLIGPSDARPAGPGGRSRPACRCQCLARRQLDVSARGATVRIRREQAFILIEGRQLLAAPMPRPLARLSGEPRHRDNSRNSHGLAQRRDGPHVSDPDHHAVDGGLALVPVKAPRFAPTTPTAWLRS